MHPSSVLFTVLSFVFLSALAAPLSVDRSLNKRTFSGRGTWFYDGLGACGYTNQNSDPIVALSVGMYGSGGYCGQWVSVTNTANQETAYGMVRDKCQACGEDDLDMSTGLFQQIGDLNTGVLSITWNFLPPGSTPP